MWLLMMVCPAPAIVDSAVRWPDISYLRLAKNSFIFLFGHHHHHHPHHHQHHHHNHHHSNHDISGVVGTITGTILSIVAIVQCFRDPDSGTCWLLSWRYCSKILLVAVRYRLLMIMWLLMIICWHVIIDNNVLTCDYWWKYVDMWLLMIICWHVIIDDNVITDDNMLTCDYWW